MCLNASAPLPVFPFPQSLSLALCVALTMPLDLSGHQQFPQRVSPGGGRGFSSVIVETLT